MVNRTSNLNVLGGCSSHHLHGGRGAIVAVPLQAASLVLCIFGFYRFYSRVERSIANPFTDGVVLNAHLITLSTSIRQLLLYTAQFSLQNTHEHRQQLFVRKTACKIWPHHEDRCVGKCICIYYTIFRYRHLPGNLDKKQSDNVGLSAATRRKKIPFHW